MLRHIKKQGEMMIGNSKIAAGLMKIVAGMIQRLTGGIKTKF